LLLAAVRFVQQRLDELDHLRGRPAAPFAVLEVVRRGLDIAVAQATGHHELSAVPFDDARTLLFPSQCLIVLEVAAFVFPTRNRKGTDHCGIASWHFARRRR
jgi:hypothetical protein